MIFTYSNNILIINLNKKVDYLLPKHYEQYAQEIDNHRFQIVEIDFAQTKFITLAGGMYLFFILAAIINLKNKNNIYVESRMINLSESLLNSIVNFGLVGVFISYANLKVSKSIKQLSESKGSYWKNLIKNRAVNLNTIYWPVTIIPTKTSGNFERDVSSYINNFVDYFNALSYNNFMGNLTEEVIEYNRKSFIRSINEATKNVWDHSQSWGAASIYSSRNNKTTMCLFDHGIGFINSFIKRKGEFERNATNDKKILKWLFDEHNTSNSDENHGRGLARIAKFIDATNGIWLIRTDRYMMQYDSKGLKITEQNYFPGTQIMINF